MVSRGGKRQENTFYFQNYIKIKFSSKCEMEKSVSKAVKLITFTYMPYVI